jgi:phage tail sheath protein FI
MAFQVSPGVAVAEIDLTTRVPIPSISDGAIAGNLTWGPLEVATLVTSEEEMVAVFGKPNANTYKTFFSATSFLSYSNKLRVVRAANTSVAKNAVTGGSAILIRNDKEYQNTYESTTTSGTSFTAKYPGVLGNSMKMSICVADRANTQVNQTDGTVSLSGSTDLGLTGTWSNSDATTGLTGVDTIADVELRIGDVVVHGANSGVVTSITSNTVITISQATGGTEITGMGDDFAMSGATLIRKKRSAFEEASTNMLGSLTVVAGSSTITGTHTNFTRQIHVGDILTFKDDSAVLSRRRVTAIASSTSLTVATKLDRAVTTQADWSREWEYRNTFGSRPPLTSPHAYEKTGSKDVGDEIHVVIVDEDGEILGVKDSRGGTNPEKQVIDAWEGLSVASGATGSTGEIIYYKEAINDSSRYVRWTDHDAMGDAPLDGGSTKITYDWGATLDQGNTSAYFAGSFSDSGANGIMTASFSSGADGYSATASDEISAYSYFKDPAKIDVSLLISGEASNTLCTYLINEIAESRKDCVVFISPEEADVVNKEGSEITNVVARRNAMPSTSYAVMDGSYKYIFDRYNSMYRWIPMNADVAGICAQADNVNPYVSPAGFTRGNIKGAEFLAYVPNNAERDDLYTNGINPIASFPGKGKVLFGDKTLLARPSSFDRINVRRLFIILEKAIANAAENLLFEFNDDFTRLNFVSIVEPFLRDIQARRGIEDFKVICDGTNNTPVVINRNEFRGDIFIKPTKSINFIGLNFVAVASGVEFSEVVNAI